MKSSYYTVDQVAEIVGMHPKTIRRFIREGKLKAYKIGKQWRITGHDLSIFTEGGVTAFELKESDDGIVDRNERKITVSSVIDIDVFSKDESINISNMLMASMNGKDPSYGNSTMNIQLIENGSKIRVMIWGSIDFVEIMIGSISAIANMG
jgi:excisionase family DNA binding protein